MAGGLPVGVEEVREDMDGALSERSRSGVAPAALIDGAPAAHDPTKARSGEEEDLNTHED